MNTKEIRKLLIRKGMKVTKLSEEVGSSYSSVLRKLNNDSPMTLDEANRWQRVLDIPDEQFVFYFVHTS